jgi:hypothetical protein
MLLESDGPWRANSRSLEDGATGMFPLLMCVSFSSATEGPRGILEEVIRESRVAASEYPWHGRSQQHSLDTVATTRNGHVIELRMFIISHCSFWVDGRQALVKSVFRQNGALG